jgi:hypothetical protein
MTIKYFFKYVIFSIVLWAGTQGFAQRPPAPTGYPDYLSFNTRKLDEYPTDANSYSWDVNGELVIDAISYNGPDAPGEAASRGAAGHYGQGSWASHTEADTGIAGLPLDAFYLRPGAINAYFNAVKEALMKLAASHGPATLGWTSDFSNNMFNNAMKAGGFDNIPAMIAESGHPDALEAGVPNTAAGVWQVFAYMRDKYAPNVKLATHWHLRSTERSAVSDAEIEQDIEARTHVLKSYGFKWDAIKADYNETAGFDGTADFTSEEQFLRHIYKITQPIARNGMKLFLNISFSAGLEGEPDVELWTANATANVLRNLEFMQSNHVACLRFDRLFGTTLDLSQIIATINDYRSTTHGDNDGDGLGDKADPDDDNDGVYDWHEAFPFDPSETTDGDHDGIGDNADPDDDNDGVLDGNDPDDDNDGVLDEDDELPTDPSESLDTDLDGLGNNADPDDDGDAVLDGVDIFPLDPDEWDDADNDGIGGVEDLDDDNDGTPDLIDGRPLDPTETADSDYDGIGDNADLDDDNDGIPDENDLFPFDPYNNNQPPVFSANPIDLPTAYADVSYRTSITALATDPDAKDGATVQFSVGGAGRYDILSTGVDAYMGTGGDTGNYDYNTEFADVPYDQAGVSNRVQGLNLEIRLENVLDGTNEVPLEAKHSSGFSPSPSREFLQGESMVFSFNEDVNLVGVLADNLESGDEFSFSWSEYSIPIAGNDTNLFLKTPGDESGAKVLSFAPHSLILANELLTIKMTAGGAYLKGFVVETLKPDQLTYSKLDGPDWLNVSKYGTLSGLPSASDIGMNVVLVGADDGVALTTAVLNVPVGAYTNINQAPYFLHDPIILPAATKGEAYEGAIHSEAVDVDAEHGLLVQVSTDSTSRYEILPEGVDARMSVMGDSHNYLTGGSSVDSPYSQEGVTNTLVDSNLDIRLDMVDGKNGTNTMRLHSSGFSPEHKNAIRRGETMGFSFSQDVKINSFLVSMIEGDEMQFKWGDYFFRILDDDIRIAENSAENEIYKFDNSLSVLPANELLTIKCEIGDIFFKGFVVEVVDPSLDAITFSKVSGPAWLNVAADGTLSGIPTGDSGTTVFTVQALDSLGGTSTVELNIPVGIDTDSDGRPNSLDLDDDNDGVPDVDDYYPLDSTRWQETLMITNTFAVVEDSYIHENKPTLNYGTIDRLPSRSEGTERYPYLKFDVSGISGTVTEATLFINSDNEDGLVHAWSVSDNSWTETGITWSNAPARETLIGSQQAFLSSLVAIDITGYISDNGTYSIGLGNDGSFGDFFSRETGDGAYLQLITMPLDSDGDGLSDEDEIGIYGTNPLLSDTDGDGMDDGREVLAGTDPLDEEDVFKVASFSSSEADVYSMHWNTVTGRDYSLWSNPDLGTGSWTQVQGPFTASNSFLSISLTNEAPTLFYRVEVQVP